MLKSGRLAARFEPVHRLRINVLGLGTVLVDGADVGCPAPGCDVTFSRGASRVIDAVPSPGWLLEEVSGACTSLPCDVATSTELSLRFIRGRRLRLIVEGRGAGDVQVGATTCASSCELIIPTEVVTAISATPRDDFNRFSGFDGACVGTNACVIGIGTEDAEVVARFGNALEWVRSFPLTGDENGAGVVYADAQEIAVARSVWGNVDIDGTRFSTNVGSTGSATMASLDWNGGVNWAWMLNEPDGGVSTHLVNAIARLPSGALVAAGSCLNGTVRGKPCSSSDLSALRLLIEDGGVSAAETSTGQTQYLSAVATDAGVILAQRRFTTASRFELTAPASITIQASLDATNTTAQRNAGARIQEGVLFAMNSRPNVRVGDCSIDGGYNFEAVLVRLNVDPLRCDAVVSSGAAPTNGASTDPRALRGNGSTAVLLGLTRPGTTFGSQMVMAMPTTGTSTFVSRLTDARFEDTGWSDYRTPTTILGPLLNEVAMVDDSIVVAGTGRLGETFFGQTLSATGAVIIRFAHGSVTDVDRIWRITTPSPQLDEVSSINIASWGDTLIVSIIASNGMINGVPLSNDGRKYWHVLALRY